MAEISPVVGRSDALAELHERVTRHRFVTLVGTPGVGKTRLAHQLVGVADESFRFGTHVARLAALTEGHDLAESIAGQLGFGGADAMEIALGSGRQLLVVDRCDRVASAAATLVDRLLDRCPELHVVATSRAPLGGDGERIFAVEPLALPVRDDPEAVLESPAVRLFLDRAEAAASPVAHTHENLLAVATLVRKLDGLPLAIELAAARARLMAPPEIVQHMDRRLDLLRRPGDHGPERHGSLRATIDSSYELLDATEREAFRLLGVTRGAFTVTTARRLIAGRHGGLDDFDTLDLLGRLVDRSLVMTEHHDGVTWYRLLATLRHYAEERLVAAGELDATRSRFVDAMVSFADEIVVEGLEKWSTGLLRRIQVSFTCLRTAIDHAIAIDDDATRALRLSLPLYGAIHGSRPVEVARIGARILERWPDGDEPLRPEATAMFAMAELLAGHAPVAERLATEALGAPTTSGEPSDLTVVFAERARGFAAWYSGDAAAALAHLGVARAAGARLAPTFMRELTVAEASVIAGLDDVDAALASLETVLTEALAVDESVNAMWACVARASVLVYAGDNDAARAALRTGGEIAERLGDVWGRGSVERIEATIVSLESGFEAARPIWRRLIEGFGRHGDLEGLALTLRMAAASALRSGHDDIAFALAAATPERVGRSITPSPFAAELAQLASRGSHPSGSATLADVRRLLASPLASDTSPAAPGSGGSAAADVPAGGRAGRVETGPPGLVGTGDGWELTWEGTAVRLAPAKGLGTLAHLLANSGREVHVLDLMGGVDIGDAGPVIDETARRRYQERIVALQAEVDDAVAANDTARAEVAEIELDRLVTELSSAYGIGGRERRTGATVERARAAVRWRVRSAIDKVAAAHPAAGEHLAGALRTGTWCAYEPDEAVEWHVAEVTANL